MTGDDTHRHSSFVNSFICHTPLMHFRYFLIFLAILLLSCILPAGVENSEVAAQFESLGPFGGDVRSLLLDAQQTGVVYLGTSTGRIFKSEDSGKSWARLYPGIGRNAFVIDTLVQHPRDRDHIYAGAWDLHSEGGGLFETTDAGSNWTRLALPQAASAIRGLSICKSRPAFMIVGTLGGAFVSSDGGGNWKRVGGNDLQKAESVAIDPVDPRILYVGTWRLGYKSTDSGKTWTLMNAGMPLDSDVFSIAIDPRNPSIVYSSACSGVYRSTNQARSWKRLRILPDRFTIRAQVVYIDPVNPQRLYSGTTEGLFVSNNDGLNWTRLTSSSVTVNAIQVNPKDNKRILIGTEYEGMLASEDAGKTWKESNAGFIHRQISWLKHDPENAGKLVAGIASGTGGLYSYDAGTGVWEASQILPGMRVLSFLMLPKNQGKLAGTAQGLFWRGKESGPWTKVKGSIARRAVYSLELDPQNPVIYAGTDQGIYRTSISAMDFRLPPAYRLSPQVWCITAPATATGVVYAGSSLGLLRSWDRGTIWNAISAYGLPSRTVIESIALSPLDKDHLFAGTPVGLYESRNGGIHWRMAGDGQLGMHIPSVLFLEGSRMVAADADTGSVFYSQDEGESWVRMSAQHASPVTCLAKDPERSSSIYIGTQSDGVYRLAIP
jgi:photosystem II stability/assembly factor-like uncharacterized protein